MVFENSMPGFLSSWAKGSQKCSNDTVHKLSYSIQYIKNVQYVHSLDRGCRTSGVTSATHGPSHHPATTWRTEWS